MVGLNVGLMVGLDEAELFGQPLGLGAGDNVGVMLAFGLGATATWQLTKMAGKAKRQINFAYRLLRFIF